MRGGNALGAGVLRVSGGVGCGGGAGDGRASVGTAQRVLIRKKCWWPKLINPNFYFLEPPINYLKIF